MFNSDLIQWFRKIRVFNKYEKWYSEILCGFPSRAQLGSGSVGIHVLCSALSSHPLLCSSPHHETGISGCRGCAIGFSLSPLIGEYLYGNLQGTSLRKASLNFLFKEKGGWCVLCVGQSPGLELYLPSGSNPGNPEQEQHTSWLHNRDQMLEIQNANSRSQIKKQGSSCGLRVKEMKLIKRLD